MSFAADTKNELAHVATEKKCCMLAEIAGFVRMCGTVKPSGGERMTIVVHTENPALARRFKMLLKEYFKINADLEIAKSAGLKKGRAYYLNIPPEEKSEQVLRETGILMVREGLNYFSDGVYDGLIKTKCCRKAYLRGFFLGSGTISDPEKGYHIEFVCNTEALAADVKKLINSFVGIHAKAVKRKKSFVVYVKDSGQITDILNIMGAHSHLLVFENVKIMKEMRNKANRVLNCDSANLDKTVNAAERQISCIRKVEAKKGLGFFPDKLFEVAVLRLENPEASLAELAGMMDPPMKKSGVNNRLRKIE
ncbi:MAG: DNA-binding protein WhiA, partial [Clostridiales bacterium]|nr:DNA-binding protein WhiA [Clostridiales bacterium]